jgi:hypothetical protein
VKKRIHSLQNKKMNTKIQTRIRFTSMKAIAMEAGVDIRMIVAFKSHRKFHFQTESKSGGMIRTSEHEHDALLPQKS